MQCAHINMSNLRGHGCSQCDRIDQQMRDKQKGAAAAADTINNSQAFTSCMAAASWLYVAV